MPPKDDKKRSPGRDDKKKPPKAGPPRAKRISTPPPPAYRGGPHEEGMSSWGPILHNENILAAVFIILCAFPWVGLVLGVVFLIFISPMSQWFRFNLFQGIVVNIGIIVLWLIFQIPIRFAYLIEAKFAAGMCGLVWWVIDVLIFILLLLVALKYFIKEDFEFPIVGPFVKKELMNR